MLALKRQPTISIKTVGPFDLGRLARLHQSCFDDAWSRADLAHLLALPGGFGLLARLFEGNLSGLDGIRGVGFALCRVVRDEGELLSIGVGPSYRRRQIGAVLLRDCMERCQRIGAETMFLEVAADNYSAQNLYHSFGFVEVGRREGYYQRPDGSRMTAYTMRSDLRLMDLPAPSLQTCP
ncbi:MAG: GNAT family N-acetyltransferase [Alphaproteobacteria bacterium]